MNLAKLLIGKFILTLLSLHYFSNIGDVFFHEIIYYLRKEFLRGNNMDFNGENAAQFLMENNISMSDGSNLEDVLLGFSTDKGTAQLLDQKEIEESTIKDWRNFIPTLIDLSLESELLFPGLNQLLERQENVASEMDEGPSSISRDYLAAITIGLDNFANSSVFSESIDLISHGSWHLGKTKALLEKVANFEIFPDIKIENLTGLRARGAFGNDTIYISQEFFEQNLDDPQQITDVILEEIGHYLDSKLNQNDSPGDEGAIFASLVQKQDLYVTELHSLQQENDQAKLDLGGEVISVELSEKNFIFQQSKEGLVSLEAEQYHHRVAAGVHEWTLVSDSEASGGEAMQATPDEGRNNNSGYSDTSPRLDYEIELNQTGQHYVWVLGRAAGDKIGTSDSLHVGLNGQEIETADRISGFDANWGWSNGTMDRTPATLEVTSTGVQTLNLWMREDGFRVDRVILASDPNFDPMQPAKTSKAFEQDQAGLVSLEAEQYHHRVAAGVHEWTLVSDSEASGGEAMQATPDEGRNNNSGYSDTSPRLDYEIELNQTGQHYVWVLGRAVGDKIGTSDSLHVGLNGQEIETADRISGFDANWGWSNGTMDGTPATLEVTSTGVQTLNLWMREDGFRVDRVILASDPNFDPMQPADKQDQEASGDNTSDQTPLPIIPGAQGYGMETPAGSGRHLDSPQTNIYKVTNLNASGPGSLKEGIEATGPRTIVFEVSGVINLTSDLEIKNPYLTIAGQTAPAPGISLFGAGIRVRADDVLIQHIRVRVGDKPDGEPVHDRDALSIMNKNDPPERVILDHVSGAFSLDEMFSTWYDLGDISITNSILGWPLHDSIHIDEGATEPAPHGYGPLLNESNARVFMGNNLLAHNVRRSPRSLASQLVFANNAVHNYKNIGTQIINKNQTSRNTVVGNFYQQGVDSRGRLPITNEAMSGSKVFVADNMFDGLVPTDPWSIVETDVTSTIANSVPTDLVPSYMAPDQVPDFLSMNVGAWPSHRDSVDKTLVDDLLTDGGQVINCIEPDGSKQCQKNAGGWPVLPKNRHTLNIPADPTADDDGDGYTNLENWLHVLDRQTRG